MLVAVVLILLVVIAVVGYPLLSTKDDESALYEQAGNRQSELQRQKESAYAAIKELDFDRRTGKLSQQDFEELYAVYQAQALGAIEALEKAGSSTESLDDEALEEQIRTKRKRLTGSEDKAELTCIKCNEDYPSSARFCSTCGAKLKRLCPDCRSACDEDVRFCSQCGTDLQESVK